MSEIVRSLRAVNQRVLTSATDGYIPEFLGIEEPISIDYLNQHRPRLVVKTIAAEAGERLDTLAELLGNKGQPGIIFAILKIRFLMRVTSFSSRLSTSVTTVGWNR